MRAVAFDTETRGFRWWDKREAAFLATWADCDGEYWADLSDDRQVRCFRAAIDAADIVIGHNLKFDVHQVRYSLGFDPIDGKIIADTDSMSRLLHPEGASGVGFGHGLKPLASIYLDPNATDSEEAMKEMGKQLGLPMSRQSMKVGTYFEIYRAFPDVMLRYALNDARYTYDLWDKWRKQIVGNELYELEMYVLRSLIESEERGIYTDQAQCAALKKEYSKQQRECYDRVATELGEQALGGEGSESALIEALLMIGVPLTERTESGKLATNKFALQPFAKEFPVIEDLFELRRLERFLSTYIGAVEGNQVIHASFQPIGAWTGRMACRSPNMQNFPKKAGKEVRSVLVPREGYAFVAIDYSGIEERLLAYYLNDPGYKELVMSRDPHAYMADYLFGGGIENYLKGGPNDVLRDLSKNMKYAITYGAGRFRLQSMMLDAGIEATEAEAATKVSQIKAALPNYYYLTGRIKKKIQAVGYVNTILGRKQPVSKDKAYVGLNALIQGSAADIMKLGWRAVCEAIKDIEGATAILVVHDEAVVECLIEDAERVKELMMDAMLNCIDLGDDLKLAVSASITTTSYADA